MNTMNCQQIEELLADYLQNAGCLPRRPPKSNSTANIAKAARKTS